MIPAISWFQSTRHSTAELDRACLDCLALKHGWSSRLLCVHGRVVLIDQVHVLRFERHTALLSALFSSHCCGKGYMGSIGLMLASDAPLLRDSYAALFLVFLVGLGMPYYYE